MNNFTARYLWAPALLALLVNSMSAAEPRVLIPVATEQSTTWRYTTEKPADGWLKPDFDDRKWAQGKAGFGVTDQATPPDSIGTAWKTQDIWLRKVIDVPDPLEFTTAGLIVRHDEDVDVYIGGTRVFSIRGFNMKWTAYDVTKPLKATLKPGKNLVAVHVRQTTGGQYIDLGLVLDPGQKLAAAAKPIDPELQRLRDARWSEEKAWAWYADAGVIVGCNYLPRTAVNMTEMWQKETFDPETIDEELGWAAKVGYNNLRVFVQYLVWKQDPEGLKRRMDQFLAIAEKHGMRVMFLPFCDCAFAGREPYLGKQDEPVPGVHNSGWVPSPGLKLVADRSTWPDLERYIKDLIARFGNDRRVLIWDLYNEPGNSAMREKSLPLAIATFRWAREAKPSQPLTIAAWSNLDGRMSKALMEMSDVVSFHGYGKPESVVRMSWTCRSYNRPVLCTEWLHRQTGNTFESILPIFARDQIGGYHWGLVAGRTQTYMPWGSRKGDPMPKHWQHDVFHGDGKPYNAREFELLRKFREDFRLGAINRRWSKEKIGQWYERVGPIAGCNYLPRTAINSTEMWQADSFDPKTIDEELGWAKAAGYNSVRVFLQYIVWKDDPDGLKRRLAQFLTIAEKHAISVMPVLFCDCAFSGKEPYLGKQDAPRPGKPNGGWVPSPGLKLVADRAAWPDLKRYVQDVVGRFADDRRILVWDLYNEPGQSKLGEKSMPLSEIVFEWARDARPSQPLTVAAWVELDYPMSRRHMQLSDVISFHGYDKPAEFEEKIRTCQQYERPIICTEWLMRQRGNTFASVLPVLARHRVGGYHWGLVAGKTQTSLPWEFKPGDPLPKVWQHDVMHPDGKPYDAAEFDLLRQYGKDFRRQPKGRRWSKARVRQWYNDQPWPCGFNYIPANAISYTEMWMPYNFDPKGIDRELAMAEDVGFNCLRVTLPFVVWEHDPEAFKKRLDSFLSTCDKRGLKVMFALFDDCAFGADEKLKNPVYGRQPEVLKGWYANGWTPSPGHDMVRDKSTWPRLQKYVQDVIGAFKDDRRVWIWDLYNEPTNGGLGNTSVPLTELVFRWAREVDPSQPLTVAQWNGNAVLNNVIYANSDVITFHNYGAADNLKHHIAELAKQGRPLINTEWLNRGHGSLVETCLPVFHQANAGCMHWGLVNGKTQTNLAWGWRPGMGEPKVWQHDLFHADGKPYRPEEIKLFKQHLSPRYLGWKAHTLENELVRLHVVPEIGGRVIQYALGQKEFFWVNPALHGKTSPATGLDPQGEWLNYGGDKLWPAPQGWDNDQQWPGPPDAVLDGQPYRVEADTDAMAIRVTSRDDPRSGIRFSRRIRLDPRSTRVSIEATMTNVDDKPRRWGIWAHTQLDAGLPESDDYNRLMRAWCPINPQSHFERGYDVIFGEQDSPSFEADAKTGLMKVSYHYKVGKIGLDSHAGWVATVDGRRGDVFVQHFKFEPERAYPDGSSVEFWHNGPGRIYAYNKWMDMADDPAENPYVFESEVLSPLANLQPGESYTWRYQWSACRIGGDFPVVGCSKAGLISQPLTARRDGDRLRLSGRFGVFHLGRLAVELYDEKAKLLATETLNPAATPLEPVVIDHTIDLPAAASSMAVILQDRQGTRIGEIARSGI